MMSTRGWGIALVAAAAGLAAPALTTAPATGASPSPWLAPASEKDVKNPVPAGPESLARGRDLFEKYCLACHGEKGDGKGPLAIRLHFTAADLTDAVGMTRQADGEIFWKISTGRDPMPSFKKDKGLPDAQIWDLVNHVRTLAAGASGKPPSR